MYAKTHKNFLGIKSAKMTKINNFYYFYAKKVSDCGLNFYVIPEVIMSEKRGIDVSYAQGDIDFSRLDKSQVSFAIVRSSFGWESGQKDSKFDRNIKGFHDLGIPCGAYHYSYARSRSDALQEAEYCLSCIRGTRLELPVFYDLEESSAAALGKRVCTDIIKTFCDRVKSSGYGAGFYTNPSWLENYLFKSELLGRYELWLAQWGASKPAYSCAFWQYRVGESGSVRGINGRVDLDYMLKGSDRQEIKVGDTVQVLDPINYDTGEPFVVYPDEVYSVIEIVGDRVVIGIDGAVTAPIDKKYLRVITSPKPSPVRKTYYYIIRPGDTLTSIAERYHTTVDAIVKENHIKDPDLIYSGRILRITI